MNIKQRVRSPRYPSSSLPEAERMVRSIFEKDGMNAVDRESAVKHIGYTSVNGASATALASLKQYGLTADAGKGMLQLTGLALDIIEPETDNGRIEALKVAAFNPDLFDGLRQRFPEKTPSESNLRAHLLRQEFTTAATKAVVPAYLQTCEYVASLEEPERYGQSTEREAETPEPSDQESSPMKIRITDVKQNEPEASAPAPSGRRMVFDTEEGEVMFTYPDSLSEESVEDIEEWFALVAKRLRRATKH